LGGAIHYQIAEKNPGALPLPITDTDLFVMTFDASAELGGGNIYGAVTYSNADMSASLGGGNIEPWGIIVGGGWYLNTNWELFGRYEWSDTDNLTPDDVSIITFGVNGYFDGQHAKWTTDLGFGTKPVNFAVPVTGWAIDGVGQEGQFVLRSQV